MLAPRQKKTSGAGETLTLHRLYGRSDLVVNIFIFLNAYFAVVVVVVPPVYKTSSRVALYPQKKYHLENRPRVRGVWWLYLPQQTCTDSSGAPPPLLHSPLASIGAAPPTAVSFSPSASCRAAADAAVDSAMAATGRQLVNTSSIMLWHSGRFCKAKTRKHAHEHTAVPRNY